MKKFNEMTLEELWELFPIKLTVPNPLWEEWYREMEAVLWIKFAGKMVYRISHIGSTAVTGIMAKPIIDILVEIAEKESLEEMAAIIVGYGFIRMRSEEGRISFNYGYTEEGFAEKVFHLHLVYEGNNRELYFRDYLNNHPEIAKEYETLKLDLWKKFEHNRDAYTEAKTDFVNKYTDEALKEYKGRYSGYYVKRYDDDPIEEIENKTNLADL